MSTNASETIEAVRQVPREGCTLARLEECQS
jgi:hypothetical protein